MLPDPGRVQIDLVAVERLCIFVQAPRAGEVKTRLGRALGAEGAASAYRRLLSTVTDRLAGLRGVELRFTPDELGSELRPWSQRDWRLTAQGTGDLGERLHRCFVENFNDGAERVAIIGSDCPEVQRGDVRDAWGLLREVDVVLGPATDGGYWLIGLRSPQPELFRAMAWSTEAVFAETQLRCQSLGLRVALLSERSDVDTEADWIKFVSTQTERGWT